MKLSPLGLLPALSLAASLALAEPVHILKVGHFLPASSNAQQNIIQPWCEQLRRESAGRLQCQLYPSMQLGGTPAKLADMVRNGVADIVWTAPAYSAGKFPRIEAMELPFMLPPSAAASNPIIWQYYQQHARDDFKGYKVLSIHGDGGMDIHTQGKPVATLANLQNLKLRASSRTAAKLLEALGATPVSMPPAQMTEAIAKGVVDGALASWEVVPPTKLDEVTDRHSAIPSGQPAFSYTVLAMLMNQRRFDSLPADLQAIIERHSGEALNQRFALAWDSYLDHARRAAPAAQIVTIDEPSYRAMRIAAQPVAQAWVEEAQARGLDGQALLDGARALSAPAP